jgi:Protein of unknown function (DUF2855)
MASTSRLDFLVRRDRIAEHRVAAAVETPPGPGEAELAIDLFGLTANNVSYGVFGDRLSYWKFFACSQAEWGRIPVWGFATVTRSSVEGVVEGERFFGYYPMSAFLIVRPERIGSGGFTDGASHRRELGAVYNRYFRTEGDPRYVPGTEPEQVILRPVFGTSFLLEDLLVEEDFAGADTVLLSSASSKTAWGLAYLLAQRKAREVVGLTSAQNLDLVSRMGLYDRVLSYDDIAALAPSRSAVYVDFSGSAPVREAVHRHLGGALRSDIAVGFTHWKELGAAPDLPGPEPRMFFAPTRLDQRDAGARAALMESLAAAWRSFLDSVRERAWLHIAHGRGTDAIARAYDEVVAGRVRPDQAHTLSFA